MNFFHNPFQKELLILRGRLGKLTTLIIYGIILVYLDFFIITKFDTVLNYVVSFKVDNLFETPLSTVLLFFLVLIRPALSWIATAFSVYISQRILRDIERDVKKRLLENRTQFESLFEQDEVTNLYITYGRWFIDSFLLPLIRAILEATIMLSIILGLVQQFPYELLVFSACIITFLTLYYFLFRQTLEANGKIFVQSSENLITWSKRLFERQEGVQPSAPTEAVFDKILDEKMRSGVVLGVFSQGLKNIIEMAALFSFAVTILYVLLSSSNSLSIFGSTFAYAIFRMLPSLTMLLAFYQQRNNARFSIDRLAKVFEDR